MFTIQVIDNKNKVTVRFARSCVMFCCERYKHAATVDNIFSRSLRPNPIRN